MVLFLLLFYLVPKYFTLENAGIVQGNYTVTVVAVNIQCVSGLMQKGVKSLIGYDFLPESFIVQP